MPRSHSHRRRGKHGQDTHSIADAQSRTFSFAPSLEGQPRNWPGRCFPLLLLWGWGEMGQVLNTALREVSSRLSSAPASAELAKDGGEKCLEILSPERWPVIVKFHFLSISS